MLFKNILIFFLSFTVTGLISQTNSNVQWSERYKDDGHYTLLSETTDGVIALRKYRTRYPDRDREADLELIKFDNELNLTYAVELRDLEESSYADLGTIVSPEGIAHIYYQTTKSGKIIVSAQLFDKDDLHKKDIIDLAQFKIKSRRNQRAKNIDEISVLYPMDYRLSSDKSKLVIFYSQDKVGKRKEANYQYAVINLTNGFSLIHEGAFYSDERSDRYKISDIELSNNGELTYLLKRFVRDNKTEFINKKPAYAYEVHHMSGDTTDYIYDIKTKGKFIDNLKLGSDNEGSVFVAGYIRKKPFGPITSTYFLALDALGYEIAHSYDKYRPREIEDMQNKKDTELDDDFKVVDVLATDDVVYVIKQYRRVTTVRRNDNVGFRNTGFGNNNLGTLTYDWDFEELVVEGYSKNSGEMMWSVTNPRRHEENREYIRSFIQGYHQVIGHDLYLFYNERPENMERIRRKEKLKWANIPGDTTEPTFARINQDGEISYRSINGERRYHIPKSGVLVGQNNIYLIHSRSNFDDFKIGKSSIGLIDF